MLRTGIPSFDSPIRRSWLRTLVALATVAATIAPHWQPAARIVPRNTRRGVWRTNSTQERARRRRQIERGMLTASNGLVPTPAQAA